MANVLYSGAKGLIDAMWRVMRSSIMGMMAYLHIQAMDIRIKRIQEEPSDDDGVRILVDRLWPRGITKVRAHLNEWNKTVAPSTILRRKFHQGEMTFMAFAKAYRAELKEQERDLDRIRAQAKKERVTLLYGAKDPVHNHAVVLLQSLREDA